MIKTLEQLYNVLSSTGIPTAYDHFPEPQPLPVLIYHATGSDNFGADNKVYHPILEVQAVLCTMKKDPKLESKVEKKLNDNEIFWDKIEDYVSEEKCYQITYTFEL